MELLLKRIYEVISLEQAAILRMIGGIYFGSDINIPRFPNISGKDCMTREAFVYVPKCGFFLTKNSPIIENPREASGAQRYGGDYILINEQVEITLANAVRVSCSGIPTNRFKESEILFCLLVVVTKRKIYKYKGLTNSYEHDQ